MEGVGVSEGNELSTTCRRLKIPSILESRYHVQLSPRAEEGEESAARAMLSIVAIAVGMAIFKTGAEIAAIAYFEANDPTHGALLIELFQASAAPTSVFFGLWMLPLGYLFYVSGFMPKALGVVLMIGSAGYVIHAALRIMAPASSEKAVLLSVAAEVAAIAWLLAAGVRRNG